MMAILGGYVSEMFFLGQPSSLSSGDLVRLRAVVISKIALALNGDVSFADGLDDHAENFKNRFDAKICKNVNDCADRIKNFLELFRHKIKWNFPIFLN
ncbi:unnamed protein product [Meloidogyne enterolobii]|uniref:Uncharacterized protein n=3 Tax=Meloidogyne enterolobii TaxID=390850 RepID=A0ACB1A7J5_MELEN|nr:unnamed protein product [Meloidogyne enterolobii]